MVRRMLLVCSLIAACGGNVACHPPAGVGVIGRRVFISVVLSRSSTKYSTSGLVSAPRADSPFEERGHAAAA